jgi:parvulin-like peptidyl-prolyl isomerase
MSSRHHKFRAEIPRISALFIILIPRFVCSGIDSPTTSTLDYVANAPWADRREYIEISQPRRYEIIREDLAFDAFLADKARTQDLQLEPRHLAQLQETTAQLEHSAAVERVMDRVEPSATEIERLAQRWSQPIPELWQIKYIFIDTTQAKTPIEKARLRDRAGRIAQNVTPENFEDMARLWSDIANSANGGRIDGLRLDQAGPTFRSHVLQTKPGTIGGPYPTPSGWNIIYVQSHQPEKKREYSDHELEKMARKVLASQQIDQAREDPMAWKSLLAELKIPDDPNVLEKLSTLENFLLADLYLEREVESLPDPSEEELRAIYNEKSDQFRHPPNRRAREILLTSSEWTSDTTRNAWQHRRDVRDRARELRTRILEGADFAELARMHSAAPDAAQGGDMGWIQEPSNPLLDRNLGRLQPGQVSPPLAVRDGYLLLQLVEVKETPPMPFVEARQHCIRIWESHQKQKIKDRLRGQFKTQSTSTHQQPPPASR